jgi:hypothetical protein
MENKIKNSNILDEICFKYGGATSAFNRGTKRPNTGGDASKHGYTKIYYEKFKSHTKLPLNLLEIGIFQGKGLAMWSDFFPNGKIYGTDIDITEFNLSKSNLIKKYGAFSNNNLGEIFQGDSTIRNEGPLTILPKLDIIIDDGLHRAIPQYNTFLNFFPKLTKEGIYVIEDVTLGQYDELISLLKNNDLINDIKNITTYKYPTINVKTCNLIIIDKT